MNLNTPVKITTDLNIAFSLFLFHDRDDARLSIHRFGPLTIGVGSCYIFQIATAPRKGGDGNSSRII